MNDTIKYDIENARLLGCKYIGDFSLPHGYEEKLFHDEALNEYFLFGFGGADSDYIVPTYTPLTGEQAAAWLAIFNPGA
jgi:hypothetical protein